MAIHRSDKLKAAFFLVFTALLFTAMMVFLVGTDFMKMKVNYYIDFYNLSKLNPDTPVQYGGYKIGKVIRTKPLTNEVPLRTRVTIAVASTIEFTSGCVARLEYDSPIIGSKYLLILPGSPHAPVILPNMQTDGHIIKSEESEMDRLKGGLLDLSVELPCLVSNLGLMFSATNALLVTSSLQNMNNWMLNASETMEQFRQTLGTIDTTIKTGKVAELITHFQGSLSNVDNGLFTMNAMLQTGNVAELITQFRGTLTNVNNVAMTANEMATMNQKAFNELIRNGGSAVEELRELCEMLKRQPTIWWQGKQSTEGEK